MRCPACDADEYTAFSPTWSIAKPNVFTWSCGACDRRIMKREDPALDGVPLYGRKKK